MSNCFAMPPVLLTRFTGDAIVAWMRNHLGILINERQRGFLGEDLSAGIHRRLYVSFHGEFNSLRISEKFHLFLEDFRSLLAIIIKNTNFVSPCREKLHFI